MGITAPSTPTAIDLFAGGGGLSEGLRMAGVNVVLACDSDPLVRETHERNHQETRFLCERVELLNRQAIESELSACDDLDIIAGGPPCQGFSSIGPRDPHDKRNSLVLSFAQVVADMRPKAFIMENVVGILSSRTEAGRVLDHAIRILTLGGYAVTQPVQALSAADYGVPQLRRRVFVIGVRKDIAAAIPGGKLRYPCKTNAEGKAPARLPSAAEQPAYVTVRQAISDLPASTASVGEVLHYPARSGLSDFQKLMRRGADRVHNHHTKGAWARRIARIKALRQGENAASLPDDLKSGGLAGKYRRLRYDRPCPTVTAHIGKDLSDFIHPEQARWLSAREAARVQSFPDKYQFYGSQALQLRIIGNAVPPLLAGWVAYAVGMQIGLSVHEPTEGFAPGA